MEGKDEKSKKTYTELYVRTVGQPFRDTFSRKTQEGGKL